MNSLAIIIVGVLGCVYSTAHLIRSYGRGDLTSPHSLYAALGLLHFFLPAVLLGTGAARGFVDARNSGYALAGVAFALAALVAVQVGSVLACRRAGTTDRRGESSANATTGWRLARIALVALVLSVFGWAARIYVLASDAYLQIDRTGLETLGATFHALIRMVETFPLDVIVILAIRHWRPGAPLKRGWRLLLYALILAELAYWLPSGRKEPVVLALLLPLLVRYLRTGLLPTRRAVAAFAGFVLLLFPLAFAYRYTLETNEGAVGAAEISASFYDVLRHGESGGLTVGQILFNRFSLVEPVATCVRLIEEAVWEPRMGSSYGLALIGILPRFLWPDKPNLHYGNEFGYQGGFISEGDLNTSISVTFFGEAYLNFGPLGILPLLGMGGLFGLFYARAARARRRETWLLIYLIMIPTILYVGGTFALYFGGLFKLIPFFYLLGRFMEGGALHGSALRVAVGGSR